MMLDIETMGTNLESTVLSIGAVVFTKDGAIKDEFYSGVKQDFGEDLPCTLGTIKFWSSQPSSSFAELLEDVKTGTDLPSLLKALAIFYRENNCEAVWANGTKFDLSKLEFLYNKHGVGIPWTYNQDRCMRTLRYLTKDLLGVNVYDLLPPLEGAHNALKDAEYQAKYVVKALELLNL